ncbi:hypothetical protein CYMTET_23055 [Cymbomonas tetramitiformis]|uniref:Uncharacterized protein n=1 Tax=Cymbomonas tetramitiformis TaxID=36881 RepID=A0AAE0L1P1_9CHLO|nr:hypothetical protein CYMTET_51089 [Cymbomonas tetramitiformis]KAK3268445.1 hypothetical protein CYMTET_23055 [Cymbomonas tetramitiformis]
MAAHMSYSGKSMTLLAVIIPIFDNITLALASCGWQTTETGYFCNITNYTAIYSGTCNEYSNGCWEYGSEDMNVTADEYYCCGESASDCCAPSDSVDNILIVVAILSAMAGVGAITTIYFFCPGCPGNRWRMETSDEGNKLLGAQISMPSYGENYVADPSTLAPKSEPPPTNFNYYVSSKGDGEAH